MLNRILQVAKGSHAIYKIVVTGVMTYYLVKDVIRRERKTP